MSPVHLSGELVCHSDGEAVVVRQHLPTHVSLTRAEPGCVSFEVLQTNDPLIWSVEEQFADEAAFRAHQARVAASEWGRITSGIERRYAVEGIAQYQTEIHEARS